MVLKSYKYRIYPTEEQKNRLEQHFGSCRWLYNWALNKCIESYKIDKKHLSKFALCYFIPELKKQEETKWLKNTNAQSLQNTLEHLDKAFTKFFKEKKGFPKFKTKKKSKNSFSIPQKTKVYFENNIVTIPKFLEGIKCNFSRTFEGKIKTSTISKSQSGNYYISILVETPDELPNKIPICENQAVGIDLGIKSFATLSDGTVIDNPRYLKNSLRKLRRISKKFSRTRKDSKNREKARLKLARIHEKISNQRNDFLHKTSTFIVKNYSTLCLETLNVKGMLKNRKLARSISDLGLSEFNRQLEYKSEWYGTNLLRIGQFEPSSKTCHSCGNVKKELPLLVRTYKCENCKIEIDRDLNASLVIKNIALLKENTVGHTGI